MNHGLPVYKNNLSKYLYFLFLPAKITHHQNHVSIKCGSKVILKWVKAILLYSHYVPNSFIICLNRLKISTQQELNRLKIYKNMSRDHQVKQME